MDFQAIYKEAESAGLLAGTSHEPTPMIVQERANPLDDNSAIVKTYEPIMSGVCGFSWVNIKPGNCAFARWLKKQKIVDRVAYEGGYNIWCHEFGQSMERKEKYTGAFANVLRKYGIKAYSVSRMD
jgi:hypothetical protein